MTHKSTMLACEFGITTQAIVNNLLPLLFVFFKDDFGISYTNIANLTLVNFMIQLFTDGFAYKIISRLGYRKSGILAQVSAVIGLLLLGILPHILPVYISLLISVLFYAFGGGLLEVMVSPIVDSLDLGHSSARMSMLHSFYCWGHLAVVLISTAAIKIFSSSIWRLLPILWAIIPLISAVLFKIVPIPEISHKERLETPRSLLKMPVLIMMCMLMVCSGAAEITMAQWASLFAQKGLGIDKFAGDILGACLFAMFMGTGRLLFGIFGDRFNLRKSLMTCSLLCTACYLTAAASKNPYIALFSCAITGLSVSIMWPGVYSYSSKKIPHGGAAMFAILALFGDTGCSLGSWMCGAVADYSLKFPWVLNYATAAGISPEQLGLKIGIGSIAIFPILMFLILLKKNTKKA